MEGVARQVERSAHAAIESVATVRDATSRQMRGYMVANFGTVVNQDNQTNYRFEIRMMLLNPPHTPDNEVGLRALADLLPVPLPVDFAFTLPDAPAGSAATVGPGQSIIMTAVVDRMLSDDEVVEVTNGPGRRLYVFGTATYKDAFGVLRYTNFCQSVVWFKSNSGCMGNFTLWHNDSN
jgi:hypothetical protein